MIKFAANFTELLTLVPLLRYRGTCGRFRRLDVQGTVRPSAGMCRAPAVMCGALGEMIGAPGLMCGAISIDRAWFGGYRKYPVAPKYLLRLWQGVPFQMVNRSSALPAGLKETVLDHGMQCQAQIRPDELN